MDSGILFLDENFGAVSAHSSGEGPAVTPQFTEPQPLSRPGRRWASDTGRPSVASSLHQPRWTSAAAVQPIDADELDVRAGDSLVGNGCGESGPAEQQELRRLVDELAWQ